MKTYKITKQDLDQNNNYIGKIQDFFRTNHAANARRVAKGRDGFIKL